MPLARRDHLVLLALEDRLEESQNRLTVIDDENHDS